MKKCIISALICVVMGCGTFSISAHARWTNCSSIELGITYSDGTVSWTGSVLGNSDIKKITANYTLEKLNDKGKYVFVDDWTGLETTTRTILNSGASISGMSRGTYRLILSGTVQSPSCSEPSSSSCVRTF